MNKSFKYRLYPNKEQEIIFQKTFGCCRFIYNKMLADKIEFYNETGEILKNTPAQYKDEFEWLKEVDSLALANEQLHLQSAYKNFFRDKKIGFPKFKSKKRSKKSYTTNNQSGTIRVKDNHIRLPKAGFVKCKIHREIPEDYIIKSATISQTSFGKYFASILVEYDYTIPDIELNQEKSIGLDYSSPKFYVDSQNRSPENYTHLFRNAEEKLAKEQRKLSHMKLHSSNYEKQKIKISIIHEKIANKRKDFIEKLSASLARTYDIICVEDIDMKNMSRLFHLGKSTNDNGFGMFRSKLQQKLELQGKKLIKIDKWFPSSKMCRFCGCINESLTLADREWDCACGEHLLRDENAAINILRNCLTYL